ncbi:MAG: hypothetical protein ACLFV8_08835 [Alphaproteobacteria bacterium]
MSRRIFPAAAVIFLIVAESGAATRNADRLSALLAGDTPSFWILISSTNQTSIADAIFHLEGRFLSLDTPRYRHSWAFRFAAGEMVFTNGDTTAGVVKGKESDIIRSIDLMMTQVRKAELNGDVLSLLDASDRPVFVLKRLRATGLEFRKWYISSFFDGASLVSTDSKFPDELTPYITFINGRIHGSPGCGGLLGLSYVLDGQNLSVSGGVLILRGTCSSGVWESSASVFEALGGDKIVEQDGERILLQNSEGRTQIILTPWERRER